MRADEQEPNMRPTVAGERTKDCEAHTIKPTGGKSGGCASKGVELTSGDLPGVGNSCTGREQIHPDHDEEVS
jgi:hypothetical protein